MKFAVIILFYLTSLSSVSAQNLVTPKILIHGGGPDLIVRMDKMASYLTQFGMAGRHIHQPKYNYRGSVEEMSLALQWQLKKIMAAYPEEQKFDVITHSLGNFVALHALATANLSHRVRKFIGLAGVAFGQKARPEFCKRLGCPPYMDQLAPYKNSYIMDFWDTHSAAVLQWDHCALFTYEDRRVNNPYDAGVLAPGTGFVVDGISHLGFVKRRHGTALLVDYCYGGSLD